MKAQYEKEYTLLTLEGGFEEGSQLSQILSDVTSQGRSTHLIMDLGGLELLQSFQIGLIVKCKTLADQNNGSFFLVGDSEELRDILEVVDLGVVIQRFTSVQEAVLHLPSGNAA